MTDRVDTTGIDKGALLAELFNRSHIVGLGFLQAGAGPDVLTHDQGRELIAKAQQGQSEADHARMHGIKTGLYFDYLYGRPLKIDLGEDLVRSDLYDRDNGGDSTFAQVVAELRAANERP